MSVLQKNKKVAAGVGVAAVAAAALALGAGTYASFSDTENVPDNTFAAGSLNLEIGGQIAASPFVYSNLKPGDSVTQTISVDNIGTLDGNLSFTLAVSGAENGCVEPETDDETTCDDDSELTEVLEVSFAGGAFAPLSAQPTTISGGVLRAQPGPVTVPITVRVPGSADNRIMTDSTTITLTASLTQQ